MEAVSDSKMKYFIMGPLLMIFSSVSFAFMSYFAKLATKELASTEVTFFRLLTGTLVALMVIVARNSKIKTDNTRLLIVRGVFGGIAVLLFFIAIEKGTVTNSVVLQNTYPIFAAIISVYALKEKINLKLIVLLGITFAGVIILTRPDISHIKLGDVFALVSGLIGGFAITAVRELRKKNESVWTIFFYFCSFGTILSFILAIPSWKWPDHSGWLMVLLTSLLGLLGQVSMTSSYKYCSATVGGILSMSTCVFSFTLGVLLLGESFLMIDLIGVFLIIAGNAMVSLFEGENKGMQNVSKVEG